MSDAPAPAAPAPAAAPATQGTPAPQGQAPKPHHAQQQPRTEQGQFAGPPQPGQQQNPPAPQFVELDGQRIPVDELRARLAERREDERAAMAERQELARLRQEAQRWQRPHEALSAEQRQEIARLELQAFIQQQEEAKLPPEQRAFLQQRREFERQQAEFRRQQEEQQRAQTQATQHAERQQAAANVQAALKALGTDERDSLALRMVTDEFWAAASQGKQYPPEVVARRVQRQLDNLASQRAAKLGPKALLSNQEFVAALNGLDDVELLKALAPLGERLRALNLQARGIAAPAAAQPSNVVPLKAGQQPRTDTEWIEHFRANGPPPASDGAAHAKFWGLKDRGVL